jgi:hypothetical protein
MTEQQPAINVSPDYRRFSGPAKGDSPDYRAWSEAQR